MPATAKRYYISLWTLLALTVMISQTPVFGVSRLRPVLKLILRKVT